MDPALQLILVLLLLHVAEGGVFVGREAFAFVRGPGRRSKVRRAGPMGNTSGGFVWLDPLIPVPIGHVVDLELLTFGDEVVVGRGPERLEGAARTARSYTYAELDDARVEGKVLRTSSGLRIRTSNAAHARRLLAAVRALASATPAERRAARALRCREAFDQEAIRVRCERYDRVSRGLAIMGPLTLLGLVLGTYAVFYVPWAFARWPTIAIGCVAMVVHLGIQTWFVHRQLYPELVGDRWTKVALLVLSPGAAARARAFVGRDLLDGFHPLAVAAVLLDDDGFARFAAPRWRDLRFPPVAPEDLDAGGRRALERARVELLAASRALLEARGLDAARLEAPPIPEGPEAVAFCPRCHAQYTEREGTCEDCLGVPRHPTSPDVEPPPTAAAV